MREMIPKPLWDLILSTNDCYPGCGCPDDFFYMTLERVQKWVSTHNPKTVLDQLDDLINKKDYSLEDFVDQTHERLENFDQIRDWFIKWRELILSSLS